jgi:hypothetical protein
MIKTIILFSGLIVLFCTTGCSSTYMPSANPNRSDLTTAQARELSKRKIHVPLRVEVHCSNSMIGQDDSVFYTDRFYYPLQDILSNSFKNAAYKVFDPPAGEVLDAFTLHVTVPESVLDVSWGDANYSLQVIVKLDEPGEKKIIALSSKKHKKMIFTEPDKVPDAVYFACRDIAFDIMKKILANPKTWRTVKRFEDR